MFASQSWVSQVAAYGVQEYLAAFDLVLGPIIGAFDPELVLVSAGFDAVEGDPLVRILHGFATQALLNFSLRQYCHSPLQSDVMTSLSSDNGMIRLAFREWLGSGYRAVVECRQSVMPT